MRVSVPLLQCADSFVDGLLPLHQPLLGRGKFPQFGFLFLFQIRFGLQKKIFRFELGFLDDIFRFALCVLDGLASLFFFL